MPRVVERKLLATARRRRYSKARTGAYVYGTLRKIEARGGGGEGKSMAKRSPLARFRGFLFGRGARHTVHSSGKGGEIPYSESGRSPGFRGRKGRLRAAKGRYGEGGESRYYRYKDTMRALAREGYLKKRIVRRGPLKGTLRRKVTLTEAERKEQARVAARRRYHEKHPGAKYRKQPEGYHGGRHFAGGRTQGFLAHGTGRAGKYAHLG